MWYTFITLNTKMSLTNTKLVFLFNLTIIFNAITGNSLPMIHGA